MVVGVEDGLGWVGPSQVLGRTLTINVVTGATIDGEVGRLVNERSRPRVGTSVGGIPEGSAEVDQSELVGI